MNAATKKVVTPTPSLNITAPASLSDHLALVLLDLAGGPVPLKLILKGLRERGLKVSESAVINSLKRNSERFTRDRWGTYSLCLRFGNHGEI